MVEEMILSNGAMARILIGERKRTYLSAKRNVVDTLSVKDSFLSLLRVFVEIGNTHHLN